MTIRFHDFELDPDAPEVRLLAKTYQKLSRQIADLTEYDIIFVGHTDCDTVFAQLQCRRI